jgi:hypothetical protein
MEIELQGQKMEMETWAKEWIEIFAAMIGLWVPIGAAPGDHRSSLRNWSWKSHSSR